MTDDVVMPATSVRARDATPLDAAAIAAVNVASWRVAYRGLMPDAYLDAMSIEDDAARWSAGLQRDGARRKRTIVAEDAGVMVGYATVGRDAETGMGLLYLMYVEPHNWQRGLGRALMIAARDALTELGHEVAVLWVLEQNARARRFYAADGWLPDGGERRIDYGGAELAAVRLRTNLAKHTSET